jgi:transposase InsO family protein
MAIHQRGPGADVELAAHTDRGSQYTSMAYTDAPAEAGILASVGSVGDAYDTHSDCGFSLPLRAL